MQKQIKLAEIDKELDFHREYHEILDYAAEALAAVENFWKRHPDRFDHGELIEK